MANLEEALNTERVVYSEETIQSRIKELGRQITEDYKDKELIVIGVIKGSLYFLSDLTRAIDLPIKVDMVGFSSRGRHHPHRSYDRLYHPESRDEET